MDKESFLLDGHLDPRAIVTRQVLEVFLFWFDMIWLLKVLLYPRYRARFDDNFGSLEQNNLTDIEGLTNNMCEPNQIKSRPKPKL